MRLLFDTHAFIWWDSEPARLSEKALTACQDPANTLLLSVASAWEMQIKHQLGKLTLGLPLAQVIEGQQQTNSVEVIPITLGHVFALENLPDSHRDPFDRLLVAQANAEDATLISNDPIFAKYPVKILW